MMTDEKTILANLSALASEALNRTIVFKNNIGEALKFIDHNVPNEKLYLSYPSSPYGACGYLDPRYKQAVIHVSNSNESGGLHGEF